MDAMTQMVELFEKNGGAAFPIDTANVTFFGLTVRDYFAGQALVALGTWTPSYQATIGGVVNPAEVHAARAQWAYAQADAMLQARSLGEG